MWVDEANSQLVRLDAELKDDVTYAAGLIAKVYRGGRLTFEQQEAAPGIVLPTHTTYDFDGKKFVFGTLNTCTSAPTPPIINASVRRIRPSRSSAAGTPQLLPSTIPEQSAVAQAAQQPSAGEPWGAFPPRLERSKPARKCAGIVR